MTLKRQSLYKTSKLLQLLSGLWTIPISSNKTLQTIYNLYSITIRGIYNLYNLTLLIKIGFLTFDHADSQNIFGIVSLAALITEINYSLFVYTKNNVPNMFKLIINQEEYIYNDDSEKNLIISKAYNKQIKYYKWASTCQILTTFSATFLYIIFNIYKKINNHLAPGEHFMYEMWLPFNIDGNGTIMSVIKLILSQVGALFNCTSQNVLLSVTVFVATQLKVLQIELRRAFDDENEKPNLKIRELILRHCKIIKFVTNLNNSVSSIILLEYVLDSINLAAAMLQVITAKNLMEIVFSMVYLLLLFSQVVILAWSANEIVEQSLNVSNAIFESNWLNQSEPIKKLSLIMIMRAQKPLALTIGPFGMMDMRAGLMTLQASYSYAGVMK